ncbi:probable indole-3-acetic acid-amido synthetase GH3.9 [Amphibalanus amphitrite]|uniref:probable indole-3-acetic acid-amido synthetase GH3.9 n=1 Tax=Amphibalanus amphitrite TaxID=1232801 RepID=UPI001C928115|nr:probable indole-3-acetic acid-amido synthetase GH3.9 [Amphibalanus amphitrite]
MEILCTVAAWCLAVVLGIVLVLAVDLYTRPKSRFHTTSSLLYAYILGLITVPIVNINIRRLRKQFDNFIQTQEQFLLRQIRDNENTQYGRDHQFGRIHSLADFRRLHPVTTYSDYTEYLERAENGDVGAILGKSKLLLMACSSGTTGKSKHIPISSGFSAVMLQMHAALCVFQPLPQTVRVPLYKEMALLCKPRWRYTPSGLPIGPLSGIYSKKPHMLAQYATPFGAHVVDTETEAIYTSLLFGLRDPDLCRVDFGFASTFYNVMQFLESHWRDLVEDIRSGRLKENLNVTEEQRRAINKHLVPDPQRAHQLEVEFKKGFTAIIPRIFPKVNSVSMLHSGTSMSLYKSKCLPYLGHLKPISFVYGSSEAFFAVNTRPAGADPAYVVVPTMALVEFLPVDDAGSPLDGAEPLLADQLKVGSVYEPVITNNAGFYRYRQGDVVKVVDFYHQAPCVDFQFRAGQMLNVHMEKLSEEAFMTALQTAAGRWSGVSVREVTSAESVLDPNPQPGAPYYLVFLELEKGQLSAQQAETIDEVLREQHYVYKSFRDKGSIAPMKVQLVEPGTFQKFRQFQFDTTSAFVTQFKQPRVLRTQRQLEFFLQHVTPFQ